MTALIGFLAGVVLTAIVVVVVMPRMMIVTRKSRLGFDETVKSIQKGISKNGWDSPGTINLNQSMAKHGVEFDPRVLIVQMCQSHYAQSVLTTDRYVACLMPCAAAVWESDDGTVYISKMNTGLMGKMFGGNIAKVMGGSVAKDEHAILEETLSI